MADRRQATGAAGEVEPRRGFRSLVGAMPWWTTAMLVVDLAWLVFTLLGTAVIFALTRFVDPDIGWYLLVLLVIAAYAAFVTVPLSAVLILVLVLQRRWAWLLVPVLVLGAVLVGMLALTG